MKQVIYFGGKTCGPCRVMKPMVQDLCKAMDIELKICDIEEDGQLANDYGVMTVPTVVEKDNKENRINGLQSAAKLKAFLSWG